MTQTDHPVDKIDELPAGAVEFDYDHWSAQQAFTPHDTWSRLRNECPVAHSSRYGGFFVLSRYQDVYDALLTTEVFSNEGPGTQIPDQPGTLLPQDLDPPTHHKYRTIINRSLAPQAILPHEGWMKSFADEFVDQFAGRSEFDYATEFGLIYPTRVAWRFLGFPPEDLAEVGPWMETLSIADKSDLAALAHAGESVTKYLVATIQTRQAEPPKQDVIGAVVAGQVDDRPLTEEEMTGYLFLLLFGGLHTTSSALNGTMYWLARHPEDRKRLIDNLGDRQFMNTAVDEFVRWTSPVTLLGRTVKQSAEFAGCPFETGDRVALGFGPANFDPDFFERPDEVILDRSPNRHVAFGMGPHRCVGSHLARFQLKAALEAFLTRIPDFHIADYSGVRWVSGESRAIMNLPLVVGK